METYWRFLLSEYWVWRLSSLDLYHEWDAFGTVNLVFIFLYDRRTMIYNLRVSSIHR